MLHAKAAKQQQLTCQILLILPHYPLPSNPCWAFRGRGYVIPHVAQLFRSKLPTNLQLRPSGAQSSLPEAVMAAGRICACQA